MNKIISWDIGIKHLAYCIMEYHPEDKQIPYKIQHWNNINLLEENAKVCNKCGKKAIYEFTFNDQINYLCGIHKRQYNKIIEGYQSPIIQKTIKSICDICEDISRWDINGKNYCTKHKNKTLKFEEMNIKLKKIKRKSCKKIDVTQLRIELIRRLNKLPELLEVNYVVIENQPAFKNPVAKSIQDTLYTWFLIKGIVDNNTSPIESIHLVAPSNKLRVNNDNSLEILSKATSERETYTLTKELGIQYCKKLLENDLNWLQFLHNKENSNNKDDRKIDDLCDSMLLGAQFINSKF